MGAREERTATVLMVLLLALGSLILWKQWGQFRLLEEVAGMAREAKTAKENRAMVTTWNSAKGTHTLTTPRDPGEDAAHWAQRHATDLAAMQVQFPKI